MTSQEKIRKGCNPAIYKTADSPETYLVSFVWGLMQPIGPDGPRQMPPMPEATVVIGESKPSISWKPPPPASIASVADFEDVVQQLVIEARQ